jgi:hypothetical protein
VGGVGRLALITGLGIAKSGRGNAIESILKVPFELRTSHDPTKVISRFILTISPRIIGHKVHILPVISF